MRVKRKFGERRKKMIRKRKRTRKRGGGEEKEVGQRSNVNVFALKY